MLPGQSCLLHEPSADARLCFEDLNRMSRKHLCMVWGTPIPLGLTGWDDEASDHHKWCLQRLRPYQLPYVHDVAHQFLLKIANLRFNTVELMVLLDQEKHRSCRDASDAAKEACGMMWSSHSRTLPLSGTHRFQAAPNLQLALILLGGRLIFSNLESLQIKNVSSETWDLKGTKSLDCLRWTSSVPHQRPSVPRADWLPLWKIIIMLGLIRRQTEFVPGRNTGLPQGQPAPEVHVYVPSSLLNDLSASLNRESANMGVTTMSHLRGDRDWQYDVAATRGADNVDCRAQFGRSLTRSWMSHVCDSTITGPRVRGNIGPSLCKPPLDLANVSSKSRKPDVL